MGMGTNKDRSSISDINVTPLVDVMLVLLVIFMVTAPMMQQGIKLDLPKARAQNLPGAENKVLISIDASKKIYLGKTEIPIERLEEVIKNNERIKTEKEVYLYADRTLPYGFVIKIMGLLKDAGAENVGLVTYPEDEK
ncbi:MAG: protein TolR [Deltaproteobacteria bacterium]|nr:protein TolR [Deltaproteobacteria bacterium]